MCSAQSMPSVQAGPAAPATAWRRPRLPARSCSSRAGARGENLGSITATLMRLLERRGAAALQAAITEALARDVAHPNAVRLALERARAASGEPPPVALVLPEHVAKRDAPVRTHDLRCYDRQHDRQYDRQPDRQHGQQPDPPEDPPESPNE